MNKAEGFARNVSTKDVKRFYTMALGSCEEVRVQIDYLKDLKYLCEEESKELEQEYIEIGKMLVAMIKKWK
jgi:four helix bundle protein